MRPRSSLIITHHLSEGSHHCFNSPPPYKPSITSTLTSSHTILKACKTYVFFFLNPGLRQVASQVASHVIPAFHVGGGAGGGGGGGGAPNSSSSSSSSTSHALVSSSSSSSSHPPPPSRACAVYETETTDFRYIQTRPKTTIIAPEAFQQPLYQSKSVT